MRKALVWQRFRLEQGFMLFPMLSSNPFSTMLKNTPGHSSTKIFKNDRERVDGMIDSLGTRRFQTDEQISAMTAKELKEELRSCGVSCLGMTEKQELVAALLSRREKSCSICAADYLPDEAYRGTLCGHHFHEHCLRSAAMHEYDKKFELPRCPTCRQTLNRAPVAVTNAVKEESKSKRQKTTKDASPMTFSPQAFMQRAFMQSFFPQDTVPKAAGAPNMADVSFMADFSRATLASRTFSKR